MQEYFYRLYDFLVDELEYLKYMQEKADNEDEHHEKILAYQQCENFITRLMNAASNRIERIKPPSAQDYADGDRRSPQILSTNLFKMIRDLRRTIKYNRSKHNPEKKKSRIYNTTVQNILNEFETHFIEFEKKLHQDIKNDERISSDEHGEQTRFAILKDFLVWFENHRGQIEGSIDKLIRTYLEKR